MSTKSITTNQIITFFNLTFACRLGGIAGLLGVTLGLMLGFGLVIPIPAIQFFNLVKYPPSLSFLLLSLGFDLVVLYLLSRVSSGLATWGRPLVALGQVALYFFLVHWFVYATLGLAWSTPGGLCSLVKKRPEAQGIPSPSHCPEEERLWWCRREICFLMGGSSSVSVFRLMCQCIRLGRICLKEQILSSRRELMSSGIGP